MNIRSILLAVSAVLFLTIVPAASQAQSMAVVNIQRIMKESKAAESARQQLKAKQEEFQSELSSKEGELQKEDQELAKQRSLLAPEAFEEQVRQFQQKALGMQKDAKEKRLQLNKAFDQALSELQKNVLAIVEDLAKEKGYDLVVPTTQVLYYDPALDVTDVVLARLNQRISKITINFQ
jgi:Skp family chaperone for outer membrane proteins